jgi:hypothetical protein
MGRGGNNFTVKEYVGDGAFMGSILAIMGLVLALLQGEALSQK